MAFRFERDEMVSDGAVRLLTEQLQQAIDHLSGGSGVPHEVAVHESRKGLKRSRAVLELLRGTVERSALDHERQVLRDAGRALAASRDATVRRQTIDAMRAEAEGVTRDALDRLAEQVAAVEGPLPPDAEEEGGVVAELRASLERIGSWELRREGWDALAPGLRRTYRRGRESMRRALAGGEAEDFHRWRRQAKYLWYHLQLVEDAWFPVLDATVLEADHLGELLGLDHDLVLVELPEGVDGEIIHGAVDRRSESLRREALTIGRRLYAESPAAFVRRVGSYWDTWRSEDGTAARTDEEER